MRYILLACFIVSLYIGYSQNYVSTYSGNGSAGNANGQADTSTFNHPFGMCVDKSNNLFIADGGNNCIRKINISSGLVSVLAGTGAAGWKDGPVDSALFNGPVGVAVDDSENVYVSDFGNQRIRKISYTGFVTTVAGNGLTGYVDGNADSAEFDYPRGIVIDTANNLYVADSWNHRIRKISKTGLVSTYAGGGTATGVGSVGMLTDAPDTSARFYTPSGLAIDAAGNIYVADAYNHRIRKINTNQAVSTFAGNGPTGPGNGGFSDGDSLTAMLNTPTEVSVNRQYIQLLIGDTYNNRVRGVDLTTRYTSTLAGSGAAGFHDDLDTFAAFNFPRGVVADTSGSQVFVCDYNNNAIRLITLFNTTGLKAVQKNFALSVYPNPSGGWVTISGLAGQENQVQISDLAGNEIQTLKTGYEKSFMLDISSLPPAVYFITVSDKEGHLTVQKLVKER